MVFTTSGNLFCKIVCFIENYIILPINRFYYKHKKTHYTCCVCGKIAAPYFYDEPYSSIIKDYGWGKIKGGYKNCYICHHCGFHGFAPSSEKDNPDHIGWTWDEWAGIVDRQNNDVLKTIKEKDQKYYDYWFNGGYIKDLFGEDEEE